MAARKQTDEAKATRAFGTLTRIKAKRINADDILQRAKDRHATTMKSLDADEAEARKILAGYGYDARPVAGDSE